MYYLTPLRRYACFSCSNHSCNGQWLGSLSIYFPMKCLESFLFLSSSPRAVARKGKSTNAIVWITLTVQSLEGQHCNMKQYSMNELTDMHLVYGAACQSELIICVKILSLAQRPCFFCIEVWGLKTALVRSSFVMQKLPKVIVCFWFGFLLFVQNGCYN